MSILKDFYTVQSCENIAEETYVAHVRLNREHDIFRGHFPGNPVAPGVCMMQIVKDFSEKILNKKLFLTSASNVKFMAIINPDETPDLKMQLQISQDAEVVKVKNTTSFDDTIALKMSVSYSIVS